MKVTETKRRKKRRKCAYCGHWGDPGTMVLAPVGRVYRSEAHFAHKACYDLTFRQTSRW